MGKAKELAELANNLTVSGGAVTVSGFNYDNIVASAPGALDTLNELAAAIGDDANFSTTVTNSIATKLPLSGGTLTGDLAINSDGQTTGGANLQITNSNTSNYYPKAITAFMNSMGTGVRHQILIGKDGSTNDTGSLAFYYAGDASANNAVVLGLWGSGDTLAITGAGRVGIGTIAPEYPLQVNGTNVSSGGGLATLGIFDTGTAYNGTNPGGGITFRGKYNNAGSLTNFATVQGVKENTTDGNYASALRFTTRANGGNLTERMKIDSSGNVGIGITPTDYLTAGYNLRLYGGTQTYLAFNNSTHTTQVLGGFVIGNDGGAARITQRENQPMIIATNDTERMWIDASGNVGIGTTGPVASGYDTGSTKLTVMSTTLNNATSGYLELASRANTNGYNAGAIQFNNFENAGTAGSGVENRTVGQIRTVITTTDSNAGDDSGGTMEFWTKPEAGSLAKTMVIHSDGKVGIGTASPVHDLHIHKTATSSQARIQLTNGNTGATNADGYAIGMEAGTRLYHWLYENSYMLFATNNQERLRLDATGNVGIGTNNPSADLHIEKGSDGNSGHFKMGHSRQRRGSVGISSSQNRWYKVMNYASGEIFTGVAQLFHQRGGGYNQTGAFRTYNISVAGYNNGIYGPSSVTGDSGEGGNGTLEFGSDEALYLRVNSSVYGGSIYFTFTGTGNGVSGGWTFNSSSYSTSLP